MGQSAFIGRVAELHDLITKPELNGKLVMVESYSANNDRFGVRLLNSPNAGAASTALIWVKSANFTYCDPLLFQCNFPTPAIQLGSFSCNTYVPGTTLDFINVVPPQSTNNETGDSMPANTLYFNNSCRVIGATGPPESGRHPLTQFPGAVNINATDASVCIEFWNINFTCGNVCSVGGQSVVFRNCRFAGEAGLIVGDKSKPTKVLVESCEFQCNTGKGKAAHILLGSTAKFLNCTFRYCRVGVTVDEGANAEFIYCSFVDFVDGIQMQAKAGKLDVRNCTFERGLLAYTQRNGGDATLKSCRFQACRISALSVEGPKRTVLHVEDCVVTDCLEGIGLRMGKIQLTMVNTEVTKSERLGVFLSENLLGFVSLTNCFIKGNKNIDLVNFCGPMCPVTIDGVLEGTDDAAMSARRAYINPIWIQMQKDMPTTSHLSSTNRPSIKNLRTSKLSGVGYVECSNCTLHEPMKDKFKLCSKCENVVYCSRECQVEHWKEHKKDCGVVKYY